MTSWIVVVDRIVGHVAVAVDTPAAVLVGQDAVRPDEAGHSLIVLARIIVQEACCVKSLAGKVDVSRLRTTRYVGVPPRPVVLVARQPTIDVGAKQEATLVVEVQELHHTRVAGTHRHCSSLHRSYNFLIRCIHRIWLMSE